MFSSQCQCLMNVQQNACIARSRSELSQKINVKSILHSARCVKKKWKKFGMYKYCIYSMILRPILSLYKRKISHTVFLAVRVLWILTDLWWVPVSDVVEDALFQVAGLCSAHTVHQMSVKKTNYFLCRQIFIFQFSR
jgi:hypothetical protein